MWFEAIAGKHGKDKHTELWRHLSRGAKHDNHLCGVLIIVDYRLLLEIIQHSLREFFNIYYCAREVAATHSSSQRDAILLNVSKLMDVIRGGKKVVNLNQTIRPPTFKSCHVKSHVFKSLPVYEMKTSRQKNYTNPD